MGRDNRPARHRDSHCDHLGHHRMAAVADSPQVHTAASDPGSRSCFRQLDVGRRASPPTPSHDSNTECSSRPLHRCAIWQVRTQTSFNDGKAWFFAFTILPQDFERVQAAHHLVELNVSDRQTKFRDAVQEFGAEYAQREVFPEIESLVGTGRELFFSLPDPPRLFLGDKIIALTDQSRQCVYLLFDNFRRISANQAHSTPRLARRPEPPLSACSASR